MSNIHEKEKEYAEFMIKLGHKASEIERDYNNLSKENKLRFQNEFQNILRAQSIASVFEYLKMHR